MNDHDITELNHEEQETTTGGLFGGNTWPPGYPVPLPDPMPSPLPLPEWDTF